MARTTADLVKEILQKDYDTINNPSLTSYINSASMMVDRMIVCAARKGTTYSDAELQMIETWLAAHCYAMSDKPYKAKTNLRASATYEGETKTGLDATRYGQMAQDLDDSGCLVNQKDGNKIRGRWLGRRPSAQTDYEDRR